MTAFLTALGSLLGVWLGALLTENRSLRERAWSQKAQAYADTFEALVVMGRFLDAEVQDELIRRERSPEYVQRRRDEYGVAREQMRRAIARQSWLLPEAVSARVDQLEAIFDGHYESYFDDMDASAAECGRAEKDLRALARADMLGPDRRKIGWWRVLPRRV